MDTFGAALNLAVHGAGVALASDVLGRHALETGQLIRAQTADLFKDWLLGHIGNQNGTLASS